MRAIAAAALLALLLPGCTASAKNGPPDWLTGRPVMEKMICAVGASEPTFFTEDARLNAAENARKELARVLRTEIRSIMLDIATGRGNRVEESSVAQASAYITDAVIEESRVIDYWRDETGLVSTRSNVTYALCCMPRRLEREDVAGRFREGPAWPTDIGRTLDEVIDKLEQGE